MEHLQIVSQLESFKDEPRDADDLDHALRVWSRSYMQSIQPMKDPRAPLRLQTWMTQAGFVEVESRMLTLPLSGWPTGMSGVGNRRP